jgi:hypothetical protein
MRAIRASKAAIHVTTMALMISDLRLMTGLLLRARPQFDSYSRWFSNQIEGETKKQGTRKTKVPRLTGVSVGMIDI